MFEPILKKLQGEVSGESAFNFVSEISRFHRIQASPWIREAVYYAVNTLKGFKLDAEVEEYNADGKEYRWSCHMFKEWKCNNAELRLIDPIEEARILARWSDSKLGLMERSHPTPPGRNEFEIITLDAGEEEDDFRDINVSGKVVITSGDIARVYQMAVVRYGALGLIYDGMKLYPPIRREGDLDDALERGRSGGWTGDDKACFCFIVSPRKGKLLRKLVKNQEKKGKTVKIWANVESEFYMGKIENAVATIPGETDEEIVVVAHIDHPQGYSNDNASGSGVVIEAARAIQRLIDDGKLEKPKRSIRFLLVPEMTGTFAWLTENESRISKMVAGVNLDMVGENQNLCGGPLTVIKTPDSTPSFVNVVMEAIFDELKIDGEGIGGAKIPLIKSTITPFSGGSDHWIFSDPTVGVPCVGIAQWPDKFYHTSFDTLDKVDSDMLRKVTLMTATYAYYLANVSSDEALWLAYQVANRSKKTIADSARMIVKDSLKEPEGDKNLGNDISEAIDKLDFKINYDLAVCTKSLKSIERFATSDSEFIKYEKYLLDDIESYTIKELDLSKNVIMNFADKKGIKPLSTKKRRLSELEKEAKSMIPRRIYRGPFSAGIYTHRPWLDKLSINDQDGYWKLEKEHKNSSPLRTLAVYWVDGERTLLDIANLLTAETGRSDLEYLIKHFRYLEKMKLIIFK